MPHFTPVDFDPFAETKEIEKITFTNEPQREIWLSCIIGGDEANLSYNESVSLAITGNLNFEALKKSLNNLVLRHEALRSTISPNGETLIIYKNIPVNFELQNISNLNEPQGQLATLLKNELNIRLDLIEGPLFKVLLHQTAPDKNYLTIIKHHIIGDGWSTGIMLEDLSKMYNAYLKGNDIVLNTASQISDYASAQASFKLTKAYKQTEDYWLSLYQDIVPVVDLPTDRPRVSPRSYKGNRVDSPLSKQTVAQLKAIGAKAGASLVTTLLAAFEVFLYQETNQRDIVVGLPSSGQAASGLTNVVGHCVNLLPLKTHIDPSQSFTNYLKKRKSEVLDAYDHQRLTFGELIKKLYIPRDASRITLVPIMFNIDVGMDNAVAFDGLSFKLISNPRDYENFELYLNATGSKEGILLEWSYNTDLFDADTIVKFDNHYQAILSGIIDNSAVSISELIHENDSKNRGVSGNEVSIPIDKTFNSLFDNALSKYTNKIALVFKNEQLTYAQLNNKASRLSLLLIEKEIGVGDIVALVTDRSIEMLICLLAILKTGAAYLPLDPEYPHERIEFMLEDSSAKMLLTSAGYKNRYRSKAQEIVIDEVWPQLNNYATELP